MANRRRLYIGDQVRVVGGDALVTIWGISARDLYAVEDADGRSWFFERNQLVHPAENSHDD